ncbi:acyl carrier protein [Amycolatopsis sp. SID8362]|uniref:acyl carrier protein n=1 Tax=Amycolatopsis sp. SID8362 TaxID=2690346 RepID=UPI00136A071A|nr:acyl carrier protein [Amycolatopsis sp. SID8362]NBH03210.1 acyl carrier protein [Amycolatopsis sp. SID8362]NED39911.1 acyl carrier protein [Amycolatopsis sp. SID8362]
MTGRDGVVAAIADALGDVLDREVTGLTEETRLFDDLRLDSSKVLELLMLVEMAVDITVDPEDLDIDHLRTVRSFADYVESRQAIGKGVS